MSPGDPPLHRLQPGVHWGFEDRPPHRLRREPPGRPGGHLRHRPCREKKSVLVVGGRRGRHGGPPAAAASRGHTVTLWEKSGQLGGNLIPAGAHDFKAELNELNAWYQTQLDTLGVAVQRNHPATAQAIQEAHPDAVILAVGATPTVPPAAGMDSPKVVDCVTALTGADLPGQRILVVGGRPGGLRDRPGLCPGGQGPSPS